MELIGLLISLAANAFLYYQWREEEKGNLLEIQKDVLDMIMAIRNTSYANFVALTYFLEGFGEKLHPGKRSKLSITAQHMNDYCSVVDEMYEEIRGDPKPTKKDLLEKRARMSRLISEAKDVSVIIEEARKHHERA